jgi:hypothetical protein
MNRLVVTAREYKNPTGGVVLGGSSNIISEHFTISSTGGVVLGGSAIIDNVQPVTPTGGVIIGGTASVVLDNLLFIPTASGGIVIGGAAFRVRCSAYKADASGGIEVYGDAEVESTSFSYFGVGGALLGGSVRGPNRFPTPSGGVIVGGFAVIPRIEVPEGGVVLGGESDVISEYYAYSGDGGIVLGGTMGGSWKGPFFCYGGGFAELIDLEVIFPDMESGDLEPSDDTVTVDCGCNTYPLVLYLTHNLSFNNDLADFLTRNGFTLNSQVNLGYDGYSWKKHFHWTGYGNQFTSVRWSVFFEWGCVDVVGGEEQGITRWQFSLLVRKSDITYNLNSTTRYLVTVPAPCYNAVSLSSTIILDTSTGSVSLPVGDADAVRFSDGVGLFKNAYWSRNPSFRVDVNQATITGTPMYDIHPIFPTAPQDELWRN